MLLFFCVVIPVVVVIIIVVVVVSVVFLSYESTFQIWLKSSQEKLRYRWHWVCGGGWWWWSKVIFVSTPTFELSCGWVEVVTNPNFWVELWLSWGCYNSLHFLLWTFLILVLGLFPPFPDKLDLINLILSTAYDHNWIN